MFPLYIYRTSTHKWKKKIRHVQKVMEIGFERSLRVTLKPCIKYCQWALFSPSPLPHARYSCTRMFPKIKWVKAICPKSVFMEGPAVFTTTIHLNFYQVMSLYVYIFHFTAPFNPGPSPTDDQGGVGQGLARVPDELYTTLCSDTTL